MRAGDVGGCLSAQRITQVPKTRWLVAGWRRGTDHPPPSPDHLPVPSCFRAERSTHNPPHTRNFTSAQTHLQLGDIHSHTRTLNHTSVSQAHTSACTHMRTQTHTPAHNGTPALSHPYIPNTYNTYPQTCHTHALPPQVHSPHIHTDAYTPGTGTHDSGTHGLPPNTHANPQTPNTPRRLYPRHSPVKHPHPTSTSLTHTLTSQHSLPSPPPPTRTLNAGVTLDSTQMYTRSSTETSPPIHTHTHTRTGALLRYTPSSPQCSPSLAPSPSHTVPWPCARNLNTGAQGMVGHGHV